MNASFVDIVEIVEKYGIWGIVLLLILLILSLLRILLDEDKSNIWRARIFKTIYKLSKDRQYEKKYIAADITGRLNLARRQMPFGKDSLPKSLKLEWVERAQGQIYIPQDGELIVKLDPAETQERNVVLIAQALVHKTALLGIRYILQRPLQLSIDLNLIKNLLKEAGDRAILDWYMSYEYIPQIAQADVKEWNSKIVEIDERGLFTRLLLVELDNYGKKISGRHPTNEMIQEIEGLIRFIYKISAKNYGENAPLDYTTKNIKIGVLLVGETSKVLSSVEPYIKAFAIKLNKQVEVVYIISFTKEFLKEDDEESKVAFEEMTRYLYQRIERQFKVQKDFELKYFCYDISGRKREAKCIRYLTMYE